MTVGIGLIGGGVVLAMTNPSQADYNTFAVKHLSGYLKTEVCTVKLPLIGTALQPECEKLVDTNQPQLKVIIAANTQRKDYLFFSLYRTELSPQQILPFLPNDLLPSYEAKVIGILNTLHLYRAREQPRSSQQGFREVQFDWRISHGVISERLFPESSI
ncbi:DUF4359 domain-containing protein [Trichothermofontia sp.]